MLKTRTPCGLSFHRHCLCDVGRAVSMTVVSTSQARKDFAAVIDEARRRQHLSIRDLARIGEVPGATAQGWLNGRHFPVPALRPNYLRMVERLGLTERIPDNLWGDSRMSVQGPLSSGRTPYLGLQPFTVSDHDLYFGRESESRRLAEAVLSRRELADHGLLIVLGASGCGKSSLLAAGLLGGEVNGGVLSGWSFAQLLPTEVAEARAIQRDLVVIDQAEDVFTLDDSSRVRAIEAIAELSRQSVVVLGLRADAFAAAAQEPVLTDALSQPFLVSPLNRDEVREVILGPARIAGAVVDDDLVPVLLDDLAPGPKAGTVAIDVLPLLSNALLVTWAAGDGQRMTLADYVRSGGVASAVQGLAEEVFQSLDEAQQSAAQRLLLRLVRISGDVLVRESVLLAEISDEGRSAMAAFVAARMLTVVDNTVRISHDALLHHWTRLQNWIQDSRTDLVLIAQLRRAARVWDENNRSPDALIPVDRLEVFSKWIGNPGRQQLLTSREQEFLVASRDHFASELAREHRINARLRRGRRLALGLTALATTLAVVTGVFYWQGLGLQAQANLARLESQSRQVAVEARSISSDDPSLMAQIALVSASLSQTREAASVLLEATSVNTPTRWLGAPSAVIAKSPNEDLLARADGSGQVTLWRADDLTTSPGRTFRVDPSGQSLFAVALTEVGGRKLLAVGGQGAAGLWDVSGEPILVADLRDGEYTVHGAAFTADGSRLALATSTGEVMLWSVPGKGVPVKTGSVKLDPEGADGVRPAAKGISFSPISGDIFVTGPRRAIARWSLNGRPTRLPNLTFPNIGDKDTKSQAVAVSPDGQEVVAGVASSALPRWRLDGRQVSERAALPVGGHSNSVSYSRDGKTLLVGNSDQNAYFFDAKTGVLRDKLHGPALVTGVEMVGQHPVSVGDDGVLRVWQASSRILYKGKEAAYTLAGDKAGTIMAAATNGEGFQLWDTRGATPVPLAQPSTAGKKSSSGIAVAPNGKFMIGGTTDGNILVWPLSSGSAGKPVIVPVFPGWYIMSIGISPDSSVVAITQYRGGQTALYRMGSIGALESIGMLPTPIPQGISFSADGTLLAVALGEGNAVDLWEMGRPDAPARAGRIVLASMPGGLRFSEHSRLLAIGTNTGGVTVWDTTNPAAATQKFHLSGPRAALYSVGFSPDDKTLLAVGGDDIVWGWNLTGTEKEAYLALNADMQRTYDLLFLDSGRTLVVAGDDGAVRTWTFRPEEARRSLCDNRGDPLTKDEWAHHLPGITPQDPCAA